MSEVKVKKRSSVSLKLPSSSEAMPHCGTIGELVSEQENWSSYIEWLENYFVTNDVVTAEKKHEILLSVCGASTYQLICNFTIPLIPSQKSYEDKVK